jgi:hypothetical protein
MSRMLRLLAALVFVGGFANYAAAGEGQLNPQAEPKHRRQVTSFGESMTSVVTTRADQNIHQQYGRDSVYGFSSDSKPLTPEQTSSR